jgi:hypothetical protein
MGKISAVLRIDDAGMGDGWKDETEAAFAFADFVASRWEDDLEPLRAVGHDVTVRVEVLQLTIGGQSGPHVYALDDDNEQDDRLAIEADAMLTLLVDLGIEWNDTPEALELRSEDEGI